MKNNLKLSFVSLLISAGLLSSLSGCNNEDSGWIAEYNGEKTNVGVYIRYMLESYNDLYLKNLMGEMTLPGEENKDNMKDKNSEGEEDKNGESEEDKNSEGEEDKNGESEEDKNSEGEENKEKKEEEKN